MRSWLNPTSLLIALLMFASGIAAVAMRPTTKVSDQRADVSLETLVPKRFGDWREESLRHVQVVNPQTQELLDKLYSQVLSRVYVNADGYRIMLSIAYGSDQRGSLQAHRPEVCYPAQGFMVQKTVPGSLMTEFGVVPVRRLYATLLARQEPLTYWFTVGDEVVQGSTQKRFVDLRYALTGRIPDGMIVRVSSIDGDETRAYRQQDRFVSQLLAAVPPAERKRLSGLGEVRAEAPAAKTPR